jgi:hypothetical protein
MTSNAMAGRPLYPEYFDGNPASLNWWAPRAPMNGRSAVEDFTNHWAIQAACDGERLEREDQDTWTGTVGLTETEMMAQAALSANV